MADEDDAKRSRAAKSLHAIEGEDEFSVASLNPARRPKVKLKPTLTDAPLPTGTPKPSHERNVFIRLFAKIFR